MMTEQEHNNVQWRKVKLGDLGYSFSGLSGKTIDDFGEGKPFIPYMNIFSNGEIDPNKLEYVRIADNEHQNKVEQGDWFFTTSSETPEEVGMTSVLVDNIGEAYLNSFCFGFRLYNKQEFDPKFASYLFRSEELRKKISLFAQGSTRYNLPKQQMFEKLFISYPADLSAQRRIAAILASADKVIAATQKTIAKYKQMKQGMMEELLKPKEGWKMVKLGEVGKISMCKRVFSFETSTEGEIPFYKIGTFGKDADAFISRQLYEEYKSKFSYPKVGDILISASGTIGRTVVYDGEPAYFQDSNIIWIDNEEQIVLNQFLYYLYQTITWNLEGSTIARLYNDNFNKIEISVPYKNDKPDLSEQRRIAAILSGIDAKIAAEEKVLEKYEKVKKGLMERMLNE